jgi:hypothetical protein
MLVAIGVTWVLSFGPTARWAHGRHLVNRLPYRVLLKLPVLGSLRVPERTGVILTALLVATFAFAYDDLLNRFGGLRSRGAQLTTGGVVLLLVTNLIIPLPWSLPVPDSGARRAYTQIRREAGPRDSVLRVPADCDFSQAEFAKTQIVHHQPIVGCTGSFAAARWYTQLVGYTRSPAFNALRCDLTQYGRLKTPGPQPAQLNAQTLAAFRRQFGVRYIVEDRIALLSPACAKVRNAITQFDGARVIDADRDFKVLDLGPLPSAR